MSKTNILHDLIIFFGLTIVFIPLFKRLKLGSVLGYLISGMIVGPYALSLITEKSSVTYLGEIGLILLLFMIGQELSPRRLKALKNQILIDGSTQFIVTTLLLIGPAYMIMGKWVSSLVVSMAISLSSTAYVLNYLKESKQLTLSYGKLAFSTLLYQDLIIVPVLTLIPFMGGKASFDSLSVSSFFIKLSITAFSFLFLMFFLRPLLKFVQKESNEVFNAFCLLVIMGMAYAMESAGLSKALGAFIAGVFLSDPEFKKDVENVILPFKSMFMGMFFMTIGLKFNLEFFINNFLEVIVLSLGMMSIKSFVLVILGAIRLGHVDSSKKLVSLLAPGGEFGLVILAMASDYSILTIDQSDLFLCGLTLTLLVAPLLNLKGAKEEELPDNIIPFQKAESIDEDTKHKKVA